MAGRLYQQVQILDQNVQVHILDYHMINSETGWKINGVQLLKLPQMGV
ncbi:MAG: DUF4864 domain-containing protein [Pseudomonadota bacterium]